MSRKGPEVGMGMVDFVEDIFVGVKTLLERPRLGNTGFQIEGSDLIHNLREDRLRHASGPVYHHPIRNLYGREMTPSIETALM